MTDSQTFWEDWKSRIEFDLASFADPSSLIDVTRSGRSFRAKWTMRGQDREDLFSISRDRGVSVNIEGRNVQYHEFIAGPDMANLRQVAAMIVRASQLTPRLFVGTRAQREDAAGKTPGPALDVLTTLIHEELADATRVVMITGDAGAGKTRVLQELVHQQADKYLHGQTAKLLLYVNAQGRALARLNEALATELQDLRVGLTYHSVAVLVRLGVLVPVIDGFDELLGVSGYDDAFSSLAGFLEQLEGEGQLLASARSVYYEEEFRARASRASATGGQAWSHIPVRIIPWSDDDRAQYLMKWAAEKELSDSDSERLRTRVSGVFRNESEQLASKPLFFTRMVDLLERSPDFKVGDDVLRSLVREYSRRELKDKLLDRQSLPLLSESQFELLMSELAQEMWNQETRELDSRSVREVAHYFVENEAVPETAKQVIVERMPALAFLARSDGGTSRAGMSFEHEAFFFYFLARAIVAQFASTDMDVRVVLSRSALPEDVVERVALQLIGPGEERESEELQHLVERLAVASAKEWSRTTQVRENAGLLVMAMFRAWGCSSAGHRDVVGCRVHSVVFPGGHLRDVGLVRCVLSDVAFRRTDLTSTKFVDCEVRNVLLMEPTVAPQSTRLELNGLEMASVMGIRVRQADAVLTRYDPGFVAATLRECGAPIASERIGPRISETHMELLERLMHAYSRANPVCKGDPNLVDIFGHRAWQTVERLLVDHEIVVKERRATSGRSKEFLRRRFLPEQIMAGLNGREPVDARVREFWRALERESAAAVESVEEQQRRSAGH